MSGQRWKEVLFCYAHSWNNGTLKATCDHHVFAPFFCEAKCLLLNVSYTRSIVWLNCSSVEKLFFTEYEVMVNLYWIVRQKNDCLLVLVGFQEKIKIIKKECKRMKIFTWFQPLKFEDSLFFFVMYHCEPNNFGFWTFVQSSLFEDVTVQFREVNVHFVIIFDIS